MSKIFNFHFSKLQTSCSIQTPTLLSFAKIQLSSSPALSAAFIYPSRPTWNVSSFLYFHPFLEYFHWKNVFQCSRVWVFLFSLYPLTPSVGYMPKFEQLSVICWVMQTLKHNFSNACIFKQFIGEKTKTNMIFICLLTMHIYNVYFIHFLHWHNIILALYAITINLHK